MASNRLARGHCWRRRNLVGVIVQFLFVFFVVFLDHRLLYPIANALLFRNSIDRRFDAVLRQGVQNPTPAEKAINYYENLVREVQREEEDALVLLFGAAME